MPHKLSIKQKIIGIIMLTSAITLMLGSIAFIINDRLTAKDTIAYIMSSQAKIISSNSAAAVLFGDQSAADEILDTLAEQKHVLAAGIYTTQGESFAYYSKHGTHKHELPFPYDKNKTQFVFGDRSLDIYEPILVDDNVIGTLFISAHVDVLYANVINYSSIIIASLLATLGLALYLSSRLQATVTKPIVEITDTTKQISISKNYSLRIETQTHDEIGDVVNSINGMLEQIEDRDKQLANYAGHLEQKVEERTRELELITDQFRHQAYHDELTNLPNRALFLERLQFSISQGKRHRQRHAMIFMDLDGFKNVNDVLGHDTGDKLLIELGNRLQESVRESDTVSRFGGDEFTLLINDIEGHDAAARMAEKILDVLHQPINCHGREVHMTASLGISIFPDDTQHAIDLMKFADSAMYQAKKTGKNNYQFYSADIHIESLGRMATETELRSAVANNELILHYQPQVNVAKRAITGVEILLRWQHPERGLLTPDYFIDVAEETGQIIAIGQWVLEEACRQTAKWKKSAYEDITVAINLSAIQLYQEDLVKNLNQCITKHDMQPGLFQLELTESMVMNDIGRDREMLNNMKEMGISLAIDDFGTGYSSLNQLRNIPIDTVKIDRAFIHDLDTDNRAVAVVQTILALAEAMQLEVISEGIETEAQIQHLVKLGCNEFQGFFFSKPVPVDELTSTFRKVQSILDDLKIET